MNEKDVVEFLHTRFIADKHFKITKIIFQYAYAYEKDCDNYSEISMFYSYKGKPNNHFGIDFKIDKRLNRDLTYTLSELIHNLADYKPHRKFFLSFLEHIKSIPLN